MYKFLRLSFVSVTPEAQYSSIAMLLEHVEESKKGFMSTKSVTMLHVCTRCPIFYVLEYVVLVRYRLRAKDWSRVVIHENIEI